MYRITAAYRSLRRNHGQTFAVLGGIMLYILFGLLLWWGLDKYIQPTSSTEKKDLMQALGLILAGVAGGVGIYFTWRNQRLTQESLESTRESTEENLRLTRERQITERITQAFDQLGSEKLEIRLGGIYALERIAYDSLERDFGTIMEVLTAYVRENAPRQLEEVSSPTSEPSEAKTPAETQNEEAPKPPADIQAILTVLGRRAFSSRPEHDVVLNLSATHLRGANLLQANLQRVNLRQSNLQGSDLSFANLREANLEKANLQRANLGDTHYLTQEQINGAVGDEHTLLPVHLQRPAHWSKGESEES